MNNARPQPDLLAREQEQFLPALLPCVKPSCLSNRENMQSSGNRFPLSPGERAGVRVGNTTASDKPLILGVGNLLMGDEGVGVVAIRYLERHGFDQFAELVDGGTSGFHLLGLFRNQQHLILIDAATDDQPLGTVSLIQPRYASDFPPTLTAHDIGLKDLIESAALLDYWPEVDLITVSIGDLGLMTMELSPAVAAALPQIAVLVKGCLEKAAATALLSPTLLASA